MYNHMDVFWKVGSMYCMLRPVKHGHGYGIYMRGREGGGRERVAHPVTPFGLALKY